MLQDEGGRAFSAERSMFMYEEGKQNKMFWELQNKMAVISVLKEN